MSKTDFAYLDEDHLEDRPYTKDNLMLALSAHEWLLEHCKELLRLMVHFNVQDFPRYYREDLMDILGMYPNAKGIEVTFTVYTGGGEYENGSEVIPMELLTADDPTAVAKAMGEANKEKKEAKAKQEVADKEAAEKEQRRLQYEQLRKEFEH